MKMKTNRVTKDHRVYVAPTVPEIKYLFLVLEYFDQEDTNLPAKLAGKRKVCELLQVSRAALDSWLRGKSAMPYTVLFMLVYHFDVEIVADLTPEAWRPLLEVPDADSPCGGY